MSDNEFTKTKNKSKGKSKNNPKPLAQKGYEIVAGNGIKHFISMSLTKDDYIKFIITDSSKFRLNYSSKYNFRQLIEISRFFKLFKDVEDVFYSIDQLFEEEKVKTSLDMDHNIIMNLNVELNERNSCINLVIENQDIKKLKQIQKMLKLMDRKDEEIEDLNRENKRLKMKMRKANQKYGDDWLSNEPDSEFIKENGSGYDKNFLKPPKINTTEPTPPPKEEEEKKFEEEKKEEVKPEEVKTEEEKKSETKKSVSKKSSSKLPSEKQSEKKTINEDNIKLNISEIKSTHSKISKGSKASKTSKKTSKDELMSHLSIPAKVEKANEFVIDYQKIVSKSKILEQERELTFLIDKINSNLNYRDKKFYHMNLIYRASEDGDTPSKFHRLCDGLRPLIVMVKTTYNKRFGGFTEAFFESTEEAIGKRSNTSFLFNLDREKAFDIMEGQSAICCHKNYGPVFYGYEYCNIYLVGNFLNNEGNVARKGDRYKTTYDYEINDGRQKFVALEVEVWHVTLCNI